MNRIFHDYLDKFIVLYLDNILIFSRTIKEHVEHLKIVLGLLRRHQYKVNLEKCEFGRTKILYLGHEISAEGLRPDDAEVASIRDRARPQTVIEVRSFLGMTGYYRPFVKNYSTIVSRLTNLTGLDTPWEWIEEHEAGFKKLKYALTPYEVLKLPDPDKPFVVTTDASQYGIGAILAQKEGPKLRPIEYMSKKMPSQKLARSTYEHMTLHTWNFRRSQIGVCTRLHGERDLLAANLGQGTASNCSDNCSGSASVESSGPRSGMAFRWISGSVLLKRSAATSPHVS
ncbi:hypothetical protein CBR_g8435 [Chara braunii]|uniref:Reverse transcriptase domain-containing protein n=1 Tax=Chara braunii TaxID=69332 RepID=A0A388KM45_CHABU|nr:hypothetical protein CBR_g8435 [Chara braunii]|eukprot:GBG71134.1 hypothetical protein CBR_g8435 [Chara braunii]